MGNGDPAYSAGVLTEKVDGLDAEVLLLRHVAHGLRAQTQTIVSEFEMTVRVLKREVEVTVDQIRTTRPAVLDAVEERLRKIEDELLTSRTTRKNALEVWQSVWSVAGPLVIAAIALWLRIR